MAELQPYKADLHIHTVLSPCGDLEMSPAAIVERALARGLDMIAIPGDTPAETISALILRRSHTPPEKPIPAGRDPGGTALK